MKKFFILFLALGIVLFPISVFALDDAWECISCNTENTGRFCSQCGIINEKLFWGNWKIVAGESKGVTMDMSNLQEISISFEISSATAIVDVASNGTKARIEVPTRIEGNSLIIELGNNESFILNTDKNGWLSLENNGFTLYFARTDISSTPNTSESALADAKSLSVVSESNTRVLERPEEFSGYVYDYANVISSSDVNLINEYAKITKLIRAGQVIIVTVETLSGMTIENYAFEMFNSWGIGSAEQNDGILILLAPNERSIQIATGSGIDTQITNEDCNMLLDTFAVPYLSKNEFSNGLLSLTKATCLELIFERSSLFDDPEMIDTIKESSNSIDRTKSIALDGIKSLQSHLLNPSSLILYDVYVNFEYGEDPAVFGYYGAQNKLGGISDDWFFAQNGNIQLESKYNKAVEAGNNTEILSNGDVAFVKFKVVSGSEDWKPCDVDELTNLLR